MDQVEKIENLIEFWQFKEADKEIQNLKKNKIPTIESLTIEYFENYFLAIKNYDVETINLVKNFYEKIKLKGTLLQNIYPLLTIFTLFSKTHDTFDHSLEMHEYYNIFLNIIDKIEFDELNDSFKNRLAKTFIILSHCLYSINLDYDKAVNFLKKALILSKEIDLSTYARAHSELGGIAMVRGELNSAVEYFKIATKYYEKLSPNEKLMLINRKGILQGYKGNFEESTTIFKEGLEYAKFFDTKEYDNKGWIYMLEGNLWEFLAEQGQTEEALKVFEKNLSFYRNKKPRFTKIWILFDLIKYGFTILPQLTLESYLQEIKNSYEITIRNKISHQYYLLAKGIVLNKNERLQNKVKAQELFREVVNEPIVWFDLTIEAQRWLGRSLLQELQYTSSQEVLKEISILISLMIENAKKQNSNWLLIEAYLLQAKLELIQFKFDEFEQVLSNAQITAEENGLTGYLLRIKKERSNFNDQIDTWKKLLGENASYLDRLKQANLMEYIKDAKKITSI
jgi:tetratricopeptide (TPR) repeat protein